MELTAEDCVEVQQLYVRFAMGVDGVLSVDEWLTCWTADGEHRLSFWAPDFPRGHAALRERAEQNLASRTRGAYHWSATPLIKPAPFGATGICYSLGILEAETTRGEIGPAMIYHDELVRDEGAWKFRRRTLGPLGWDPDQA
jgi:hypothetical protein